MTYFDQLTKKAQSFDQTIKQVHAYSGSPRKGGNTDTIIKQILKGVASEKINTYSTNLSSIDFKGCIGCEKCRKDKVCTMLHDGMSILYPDI
nr:hypothetical protein [Prolixibacteraceae bacterium]